MKFITRTIDLIYEKVLKLTLLVAAITCITKEEEAVWCWKILVGVGLGLLIFTNPEARQMSGDLLRSAGDAIAPAKDGKTLQDIVLDDVVEKGQE